jgi:HlyD family secretion protein
MFASAQPSPAPQPIAPPSHPGPVRVPPVAPPEGPRRWRLWGALAGVTILGAGLYLLLKPAQPTQFGGGELVRTAQVASGPLERTVRVAGQTSARQFATIMVPTFRGPDSGRDLTLMKVAKPGTSVRNGDSVAELDAQTLQDHIDDVTDNLRASENEVLKKKAEQDVEWSALKQYATVAKADLDRARFDLKAAEVRTAIERELLKLSVDEAEATYRGIEGDMARKKVADASEVRILEIAVERWRIHRNNHANDLRKFIIKAPMDGLVVMTQIFRMGEMRQVQEGDQVFPGMPFMKIVDPRSMQMEALVSQADSSEFRLGQIATVGIDAFPALRFKGRIYSLGAMAVKGIWDTYYVRNVPVRIAIEGADPRLIPDLSSWAHIHLERQDAATIVPAEAVRSQGGRSLVYVKNGASYQPRTIEIGLRTPTHVSVISGLAPGERVALEPLKNPT